MTKILVLF